MSWIVFLLAIFIIVVALNLVFLVIIYNKIEEDLQEKPKKEGIK